MRYFQGSIFNVQAIKFTTIIKRIGYLCPRTKKDESGSEIPAFAGMYEPWKKIKTAQWFEMWVMHFRRKIKRLRNTFISQRWFGRKHSCLCQLHFSIRRCRKQRPKSLALFKWQYVESGASCANYGLENVTAIKGWRLATRIAGYDVFWWRYAGLGGSSRRWCW